MMVIHTRLLIVTVTVNEWTTKVVTEQSFDSHWWPSSWSFAMVILWSLDYCVPVGTPSPLPPRHAHFVSHAISSNFFFELGFIFRSSPSVSSLRPCVCFQKWILIRNRIAKVRFVVSLKVSEIWMTQYHTLALSYMLSEYGYSSGSSDIQNCELEQNSQGMHSSCCLFRYYRKSFKHRNAFVCSCAFARFLKGLRSIFFSQTVLRHKTESFAVPFDIRLKQKWHMIIFGAS